MQNLEGQTKSIMVFFEVAYWLLPLPHQDVCPDKVQVQWVPVVALVVYV